MANKNYCTFIIAYHDVTGLKCIQVIYAIVSKTMRLPTGRDKARVRESRYVIKVMRDENKGE